MDLIFQNEETILQTKYLRKRNNFLQQNDCVLSKFISINHILLDFTIDTYFFVKFFERIIELKFTVMYFRGEDQEFWTPSQEEKKSDLNSYIIVK